MISVYHIYYKSYKIFSGIIYSLYVAMILCRKHKKYYFIKLLNVNFICNDELNKKGCLAKKQVGCIGK